MSSINNSTANTTILLNQTTEEESKKRPYDNISQSNLDLFVPEYQSEPKRLKVTSLDGGELAGPPSAGDEAQNDLSKVFARQCPPPTPRKGAAKNLSFNTLRQCPPPTPSKHHSTRTSTAPATNPYDIITYDERGTSSLFIQGRSVKVTKLLGGTGTYMQAWNIAETDVQIVANVLNDQVLVKTYLTNKPTKLLNKCVQNSIANYKEAVRIGIPISTIYNIDTATNFFLVEKIPYQVDLNDPNHMLQVRSFFEVSFTEKVAFDLSFDNLRVREDGTVVLIDFTEKSPGLFEREVSLQMFAIQFLKGWCKQSKSLGNSKEETQSVLDTLTQDLDGFNPEWNQMALENYFH